MNPDKAELKVLITNELGADMEDAAEAWEKDQYRFEGGMKTSKQIYNAIKTLMEHADKDLEDGKFSDFPEPLVAAQLVKSWLMRSMEAATGVGTQMEASKLHVQGRVAGVRAVMGMVQKKRDAELLKIEAVREAAKEAEKAGSDADPQRVRLDSNPAAELASRKRPRRAAKKKTATKAARKVKERAGGAEDS